MIAAGFFGGERIDRTVVVGWLLAVAGLILLLLPGIAAPPALEAVFMLIAGIAWGIYSLRGRRSTDALGTRPEICALSSRRAADQCSLLGASIRRSGGIVLAALSGSLASGLDTPPGTRHAQARSDCRCERSIERARDRGSGRRSVVRRTDYSTPRGIFRTGARRNRLGVRRKLTLRA